MTLSNDYLQAVYYWPQDYYYWPVGNGQYWPLVYREGIDVTLHERLFGAGTLNARGFAGSLFERSFGSGTLDDRDISTGLHERKFGSGTLDDKP